MVPEYKYLMAIRCQHLPLYSHNTKHCLGNFLQLRQIKGSLKLHCSLLERFRGLFCQTFQSFQMLSEFE